MMYIFTTDKDLTRFSLQNAAAKKLEKCEIIFYENISFHGDTWFYNNKPFLPSKDDHVLFRMPWDAENMNKDYTSIMEMLMSTFDDRYFLDKECLQKFSPFHEDKLIQYYLFTQLGIRTPKSYYSRSQSEIKDNAPLPIVAKKRVSCRSKGNFLIKTSQQLGEFSHDVSEYIFQEFVDIVADIRLLIYRDEVIGAVKRDTHIRQNNRLAVKGMEPYELKNTSIISQCKKICKFLGADFLGFDILLDSKGEYYIIEANISPQYKSFEDTTKMSVSDMVMDRLVG